SAMAASCAVVPETSVMGTSAVPAAARSPANSLTVTFMRRSTRREGAVAFLVSTACATSRAIVCCRVVERMAQLSCDRQSVAVTHPRRADEREETSARAERERCADLGDGVVEGHGVLARELLVHVGGVFDLLDDQAYERGIVTLRLRQQAAEPVAEHPGHLQPRPGVCNCPESAGELARRAFSQRPERARDLADREGELPEVALSVIDDFVG